MVGGEFVAVAGSAVDVDGMEVCETVSGGLVGAETVKIDVGDTSVEGGVGVGADVQAVTKTTARMSTMI